MKRFPGVLAVLLLAAAPLWADPPTVTVPEAVSAQVGAPVYVSAQVIGTKSVAFLCLDDGLKMIPAAKLVSKTEAVCFGTQQGTYKLLAVVSNADGIAVGVTVVTVGDGPTPPLPGNGFAAPLAAAWAQEKGATRLADVKQLASLYSVAAGTGPGTANDPAITKTQKLLADMHDAAQTLLGDNLPAVRGALAKELATKLATDPQQPLDPATRAVCVAQFRRFAALLGGLK